MGFICSRIVTKGSKKWPCLAVNVQRREHKTTCLSKIKEQNFAKVAELKESPLYLTAETKACDKIKRIGALMKETLVKLQRGKYADYPKTPEMQATTYLVKL